MAEGANRRPGLNSPPPPLWWLGVSSRLLRVGFACLSPFAGGLEGLSGQGRFDFGGGAVAFADVAGSAADDQV